MIYLNRALLELCVFRVIVHSTQTEASGRLVLYTMAQVQGKYL